MDWLKNNVKGIGLCLAIAMPAWFLGKILPVVGAPVFAILLGMTISLIKSPSATYQSGIKFCFKKVLQLAVVLLGFGLNFYEIIKSGKESLPIILSTITASLVTAFILGKIMRVEGTLCTLVGVGSSICGGSAIAATAPVLGAKEDTVAQAMSTIFFFNVVAALLFPILGGYLGLSNQGFGVFAGTAVNDTSSVTAAATAWDGMHGSSTLALATMVKLTRTLAIIPITLALSFWQTKKLGAEAVKVNVSKIFPWFILCFVLAAVATTFLAIPASYVKMLNTTSKFFIVVAMGAIGLQTNIVKLIKTGGKPLLLGGVCWLVIGTISLALQRILGLW